MGEKLTVIWKQYLAIWLEENMWDGKKRKKKLTPIWQTASVLNKTDFKYLNMFWQFPSWKKIY